jgi:hypothetical protein
MTETCASRAKRTRVLPRPRAPVALAALLPPLPGDRPAGTTARSWVPRHGKHRGGGGPTRGGELGAAHHHPAARGLYRPGQDS